MSELRVRKIQEFIKQEVSSMLLKEIKDPRLGFVTVTGVHLTGDLREATVYVSLFGSDREKAESLEALNNARGFIRRELARTINLRNTPDITFVMDQSIEYGVNMSHKIDEVIAADEQAQKPENEVVEDTEETEEGDE